jgi:DNA primase
MAMNINNPIFVWQHHNAVGQTIGEIKRFIDKQGKKQDIPFYHRDGQKFKAGIPELLKKNGHPLFGLDSFTDNKKVLLVCEGQKAQSAFAGLGFQCVSSILGASSPHRSNWKSIETARVIYLVPDNDASGESYIKFVYEVVSAFKSSPKINIIRLP